MIGCVTGIGADQQGNPVSQINELGQLTVSFIDVGQGDSILIQTSLGQSMLIDGGERNQGKKLVEYLQKQGIDQIDVMVGTHPHSDHIGVLLQYWKTSKLKNLSAQSDPQLFNIQRFADSYKNQGLKINTAQAGAAIPIEGVDASFIAPVRDRYDSLNNYSAVVKLVYGNISFLFCGDAEEESEQDILSSSRGDLKCQVLKVGHHGSSTSTSDPFLNAVKPQYAIIMCGAGNDYGHPHQEIIEKLKQAGATIYRSDENGI